MADTEALRLARYTLVEDAEACRDGWNDFPPMSRLAWEERADASEAGKLCGPREIDAIASMVFGRRRLRR